MSRGRVRRAAAVVVLAPSLAACAAATEPAATPATRPPIPISRSPGFPAGPDRPSGGVTAAPAPPSPTLPDSVTRSGPYHPDGVAIGTDEPDYYRDGCRIRSTDDIVPPAGSCRYGDPAGAPVAILGDSKMGQWMPALQRIAVIEKWNLVFYSRSSCPFATVDVSAACARFVDEVRQRLLDRERPRLIFVSHIAHSEPVVTSETAALTSLHAATGAIVVVVEDTPQPGRESVPACLAAARDYWLDCALRKNDGSGTPGLRRVAAAVPDARLITLNDVICPTSERCPPVLDRIALYRGGSHLTRTFVEALTPTLHQRLIEAGVASGPVVD